MLICLSLYNRPPILVIHLWWQSLNLFPLKFSVVIDQRKRSFNLSNAKPFVQNKHDTTSFCIYIWTIMLANVMSSNKGKHHWKWNIYLRINLSNAIFFMFRKYISLIMIFNSFFWENVRMTIFRQNSYWCSCLFQKWIMNQCNTHKMRFTNSIYVLRNTLITIGCNFVAVYHYSSLMWMQIRDNEILSLHFLTFNNSRF